MSRGFGVVQRALLEAVDGAWSDLRPELWLCVTTVDLGLGEHRESRRRAAHGLARAGAVELCLANAPIESNSILADGALRPQLFARIPMGDASRTYVDELLLEYEEHQRAMWNAIIGSPEYERHERWIDWYERPYWENEHLHVIRSAGPEQTIH